VCSFAGEFRSPLVPRRSLLLPRASPRNSCSTASCPRTASGRRRSGQRTKIRRFGPGKCGTSQRFGPRRNTRPRRGSGLFSPPNCMPALREVDSLSFEPHSAAQALCSRATNTTGCVESDISNPRYSDMVNAAEEELHTCRCLARRGPRNSAKSPNRPTAIITLGTHMLARVMDALASNAVQYPPDISLVRVGDTDLARHAAPAIGSLTWDFGEIGRIAARIFWTEFAMTPHTTSGQSMSRPASSFGIHALRPQPHDRRRRHVRNLARWRQPDPPPRRTHLCSLDGFRRDTDQPS
jgi:Periplasmic binding protein-like domain